MAPVDLHALLVTSGVWAADLVTAGVVTAAGAVYPGRAPQSAPRADVEVWISPYLADDVGTGSQGRRPHVFELHVRQRSVANMGGNQSGSLQLSTLFTTLQTIRDRYHATRKFYDTAPEIMAVSAEITEVDEEPDDGGSMSGLVTVTLYATDTAPNTAPP